MLNDIANRIVNSSDIKNLLSRDYSSTETQTIIGYLLKKIVVLEDKFEEIQKVLKIDIQSEETCISRKRPSIARNEQDLFKLEKLSIQKLPETKEEIKKVEKLEEEQSSETNIFVSKDKQISFSKEIFPSINLSLSKNSNKRISYITVCSSAAASGKTSLFGKQTSTSTEGKKSALFGVGEDIEKMQKFLMAQGESYICQGKYTFSQESVSSVQKSVFMDALKNIFNSRDIDGTLIYYSGHGFPDYSILLESPTGNYFVNYDDIASAWRKRDHPNINTHLLLILDCCFSGSWVKRLLNEGDFGSISIQASSTEHEKSLDMGTGLGSLFTNAFIWANVQGLKINLDDLPFKSEFDFDKLESQKFKSQRPRGFGFQDVLTNKYNIKGLNHNSWQEIKAFSTDKWNSWKWIYDNKNHLYSQISTKEFYNDGGNCLYDQSQHLMICIKEEAISVQGEVIFKKENFIQSKKLIRMLVRSKEIKKKYTGYFSLFEENEKKSKYFNYSSKKILTFERSLEDTNLILLNFNDFICKLENNELDVKSIDSYIIELVKIITYMDKSCLILEEGEEEEEEDVDYFDEIKKINESNSELVNLQINAPLSDKLLNSINEYYNTYDCNICHLKIIEKNNNTNLLKQIIEKTESIEIDIRTENDISIFKQIQLFNNLKKFKIKFPEEFPNKNYIEVIQNNSLHFLLNLSLSDTLLEIEIDNFFSKYELYLLEFCKIKTLRSFTLKNYIKCFEAKKCYPDFIDINLKNDFNNENISRKVFSSFANHKELKVLKIISCELEIVENINKNLTEIDLSDNLISQVELVNILSELEQMKNYYRINLSYNFIGPVIFNKIREFLNCNEKCLEFNISNSSITEENIIHLTKYNLAQKNKICYLNLSGTILMEKTSVLFSILKSNKTLKSLNLSNTNLQSSNIYEISKTFGMETTNNITELDLSFNFLSKESHGKLALNNFKYSKNLEILNLNNTICYEKGKDLDIEKFLINPVLKEIYLDNSFIKGKSLIIDITGEVFESNIRIVSLKNTEITFKKCPNLILEKLIIDSKNFSKLPFQIIRNLELYQKGEEIIVINDNIKQKIECLNYICEDSLLTEKFFEINKFLQFKDKIRKENLNVTKLHFKNFIAENIDESALSFITCQNREYGISADNYQIKLDLKFENEENINNELILQSITSKNFNDINLFNQGEPFTILEENKEFDEHFEENENEISDEEINETNQETNQNKLKIEEYYQVLKTKSLEFCNYIIKHNESNLELSSYVSTNDPFYAFENHDNLKYIILNYNYFDIEKFVSTKFSNVEYLELNSVYLKDFLSILKRNTSFTKLKCLVLKHSEINKNEIDQLRIIFELYKKNLEEIHFINTYIDSKESKILFKYLSVLENINLLNISENYTNSNFSDELCHFLIDNNERSKSLKILILRKIALLKDNLMKIYKTLENRIELDVLDISGILMNSHSYWKLIDRQVNFEENIYFQEINYSNTCFKHVVDFNKEIENLKLMELRLNYINFDLYKNELMEFFNGINYISNLKINKCQKDNSFVYYLKRFLYFTKIDLLDLSGSLINSKNVVELIELIENQKEKFGGITKIILDKTQLEDSAFIDLRNHLDYEALIQVQLYENKLTLASRLETSCHKMSNLYVGNSFVANFEYEINKKFGKCNSIKDSCFNKLKIKNTFTNNKTTMNLEEKWDKNDNFCSALNSVMEKREFKPHGFLNCNNKFSIISCMDYDKTSKLVVGTKNDGKVIFFNIKNYTCLESIKAHTAVSIIRFVSIGKVLSCGMDKLVKIWETENYKCLITISTLHKAPINSCVIFNDYTIVTGSFDKSINVINLNNIKQIKPYQSNETKSPIQHIIKVNNHIVYISMTMIFKKNMNDENLPELISDKNLVRILSLCCFDEDENRVIISQENGVLSIYDIETAKCIKDIRLEFNINKIIPYLKNTLLILNSKNYVEFMDTSTTEFTVLNDTFLVRSNSISPSILKINNNLLAFTFGSSEVMLFNKEYSIFKSIIKIENKFASNDMIRVIMQVSQNEFAMLNSSIVVFNIIKNKISFEIADAHLKPIISACKLKDNIIATISLDKTSTIWDLKSKEKIAKFDHSISSGYVCQSIGIKENSFLIFNSLSYQLCEVDIEKKQGIKIDLGTRSQFLEQSPINIDKINDELCIFQNNNYLWTINLTNKNAKFISDEINILKNNANLRYVKHLRDNLIIFSNSLKIDFTSNIYIYDLESQELKKIGESSTLLKKCMLFNYDTIVSINEDSELKFFSIKLGQLICVSKLFELGRHFDGFELVNDSSFVCLLDKGNNVAVWNLDSYPFLIQKQNVKKQISDLKIKEIEKEKEKEKEEI